MWAEEHQISSPQLDNPRLDKKALRDARVFKIKYAPYKSEIIVV